MKAILGTCMKSAINKHILAIAPITIGSMAAAGVPDGTGPQGFLLWESPQDLPELNFKDGQGSMLTLEDFEGKVVLQ